MKILLSLENKVYDFPHPLRWDDSQFLVHSSAKICPFCLKVWAVVSVPDFPRFSIDEVPCLSHPPKALRGYGDFPGSLLDDCGTQRVQWGMIEILPTELLQREFDLHLKAVK